MTLSATFAEAFASYQRMLAATRDEAVKIRILTDCAYQAGKIWLANGLDKAEAVDKLVDMAIAHGLFDTDFIGLALARGQQAAKSNGHAGAPEIALGEWNAGENTPVIQPRQWLLANQFCRTFISSIVAAGGTGKSALRLLQFVSLALGRSLCGQHVFARSRVLLISMEDDRDELQRRITALLIHYGIDRKELDGWLFCATPKLAKIALLKNRERVLGPLGQLIEDAIARRKPDIISLDPFVKVHGLEENSSGDMDYVANLLATMAVNHNIAVDSPHHVHKGTMTPGDADSGRGSSGIRDAGRLVYTLCPMSEPEAQMFGIEVAERCSYVRLDPAKVNIAPRASAAEWFKLIGVPIGNGTAEYPNGDTVQVAEPWTPPSAWTGTTSAELNAILDDIDRGVVDDDGVPIGRRYSKNNAAKDRAAWPLVQQRYPDKSEAACRDIIRAWIATGLVYEQKYHDPILRKEQIGLSVNQTKRPG